MPGGSKKGGGLKVKEYAPFKMKGHTLPGINQRSDAKAKNVAEQGLASSSPFQQTEEKEKTEQKKDFSDESKYKTVREGRTGGIAQDIESGKYYSTSMGHEMVSDTTSNPFDPNIKTVDWYKKGDDK